MTDIEEAFENLRRNLSEENLPGIRWCLSGLQDGFTIEGAALHSYHSRDNEIKELEEDRNFRKNRADYWRHYYYRLKEFIPEELKDKWDELMSKDFIE